MQATEDQFYVGLMSNESMLDYPDNVLSSFTNKLARPIQIDEKWCVGLTHISYGPFAPYQRMELAPELDQEVETFEPITVSPPLPVHPKKKRRRREREYRKQHQDVTAEKKIIIKLNEVYSIVLTQSDLKELTYEKHHLNCGKLLKVLPLKIMPEEHGFDPNINYEMEAIRRQVKQRIFKLLDEEDWTLDNKVTKYNRHADEFLVHVYQGTKKSSNCILKYKTHAFIDDFIKDIVYQLPVHERQKKSLKLLFNLFHASYDMVEEKAAAVPSKEHTNLYIPFAEYGSSSGLNTETLMAKNPNIMQEGVSLEEIITLFRDNLNYKDEKSLSAKEKMELRLKIRNAIIDVLRGNPLNGPFIPKEYKKNDLPLNVPYERNTADQNKFNTYRAVLEAKIYDREDQFLNEIYNQIPPEKRNKAVLLESLTSAFVTSLSSKRSPSEISVLNSPKQPLQAMPYDYADPTNVKAPPISFPEPQKLEQQKETSTENKEKTTQSKEKTTESKQTPQETPPKSPTKQTQTNYTINGPIKIHFNKQNQNKKIEEIVESKRNLHKNRFIYVYCDAIRSRIIGEQATKCLRIIPLIDNSRDIQFKNVEYLPIEKTYLDSISIVLANSYGERIAFESGTVPTFLMLHFKRR